MDIFKFAFTGGPCAGKTTVISSIRVLLEKDGYYVIVVPETASELISNGIQPNEDKKHTLRFQELVLETQARKEIIAEEYCELIKDADLEFIKDKKGIVVLYDRSIPDNRAYLSHDKYKSMLKKYNFNELAIIDKYDMVINLVSLATTNKEFYCLDDVRYESPEEAAYKDLITSSVWCLHRDFKMIKPTEKMEDKILQVYEIISDKLNKKYNNSFSEYEIESCNSSFFNPDTDNSRKMKLQTFKLESMYNYYLILEKREYDNNISYILRKEWLTKDGISSESKPISKKEFDYIMRNNFLSDVSEKEILNIINKGSFFSIAKEGETYKLYTQENNILDLPKNINIKSKKTLQKKII